MRRTARRGRRIFHGCARQILYCREADGRPYRIVVSQSRLWDICGALKGLPFQRANKNSRTCGARYSAGTADSVLIFSVPLMPGERYSPTRFHGVYLFRTSALQVETKVGSLLLGPTRTSIPYSLRRTVPCATVCPPALISAPG